jgi:uridine kinase
MQHKKGMITIIVILGDSASGKTTIAKSLMNTYGLNKVISYTHYVNDY